MKRSFMKNFAVTLLILCFLSGCSTAVQKQTRTTASELPAVTEVRCGVRFGTGGEASLVNSFNEVLTLAVQGGDQTLLDQLDSLITDGSQLGQRYCVKIQFENSSPKVIVAASEVKEICGYRYGRGRDSSLVTSLKNPEELVNLSSLAHGNRTLLRQMDSFIPGGSENGKKYCVEARTDSRNTVIEILGAREY